MKKLMTALIMVFTFCLALTCTACGGGKTVSSISVKEGTLEEEYLIYSEIDLSDLVIIVTYDDNSTEEIAYSTSGVTNDSLTVTGMPTDTSTTGDYTVTITYTISEDETYTCTYSFSIVEEYTVHIEQILGVEQPSDISSYLTTTENDDTAVYTVGDDNAFIYQPKVYAVVDGDTDTLSSYVSFTQIKLGDTTLTAQENTNNNLTDFYYNGNVYVEVNNNTQEFYFTEKAIDKTFTLFVTHESLASNLEAGTLQTSYYSSLEVNVIDGYNVYNSFDLSVMDNTGNWTSIQQEQGITVDVSSVSAVILHCDIEVLAENLPSTFFYTEAEVAALAETAGKSSEYQTLVDNGISGTLKDNQYIYTRSLAKDETFTIEGNYFTVDTSSMPYITVQSNAYVGGQNSLNSHSKLFSVEGYLATSDENYVSNCSITVNNVNAYGNASKVGVTGEAEILYSVKTGGLTFFNTDSVKAEFNNVEINASYMGIMTSIRGYSEQAYMNGWNNSNITLNNVTIADSYNCSMYVWGTPYVNINESTFKNSGGPAIIADHVYDAEASGVDYTSKSQGCWVEINVDSASTIEAYTNGTETWYKQQNATTYVTAISAISTSLTSYSSNTKTLTTIKDGYNYVNVRCLFKQSQVEGASSVNILGKYIVDGVVVMDMSGAYTANDTDTAPTNASNYSTVAYASSASGAPMFTVNANTEDGREINYAFVNATYNTDSDGNVTGVTVNALIEPLAYLQSSYTTINAPNANFYSTTTNDIALYYPISKDAGFMGIVLEYMNVTTA